MPLHKIAEKYDFNFERARTFGTGLDNASSAYSEPHDQKMRDDIHLGIMSFFKRPTSTEADDDEAQRSDTSDMPLLVTLRRGLNK
ncbi:hypothetical protein M513_00531 [Trichuris suis]|uniref:Uncharacterized protein n=1 Tax=Trichuris suis TaxID=68888 RepID=A0A085MM59_9BILA|nr:hypothetical protein M513_00531 [Trichuris suis]